MSSLCLAGLWLHGAVEVALKPLLDLAARSGAHLLSDRLAALEQKHGGDAANAIAARRVWILVDVQFRYRHLLAKLGRNLFECRSDHPAWPAPFRPEVDE